MIIVINAMTRPVTLGMHHVTADLMILGESAKSGRVSLGKYYLR